MGRLHRGGVAIVLLVAMMGALFIMGTSRAETSSVWLNGVPSLEKLSEVPENTQILIGNRECTPQKVITREAKILTNFPFYQTEQSYMGCMVQTGFGSLDTIQIYFQPNGSGVAKPFKNQYGGRTNVMPIPASTTTLYIESDGTGQMYMTYLEATYAHLRLTNNDTEYRLTTWPSNYIKDRGGSKLRFNYDSIGFSPNAKWMVADMPDVGAARVNLETFEVLPFGPVLTYGKGQPPFLQTTITDDGRYAIIASKNAGIFRLYDLSTCGAVPQKILQSVSCQYQDLLTFMRTKVPGFQGAYTLRFKSNGSFTFYGYRTEGGVTKRALYSITAAGQVKTTFQYLALGDSFASGEGAHDYRYGTDTDNNKCHTSLISYPYLIAKELDLNTTQSVACSGAVIEDVTSKNDTYLGQYDKRRQGERDSEPILQAFSPGFIGQIKFLDKYRPDIITISAVGNDIGFDNKLKACLVPADDCYDTFEERLEIVREINDQFDNLVRMYRELKEANKDAKVYALSYPHVASIEGDCAANVQLGPKDRESATEIINYLNTVINRAANHVGVRYVDLANTFVNHRLCESTGSQTAVNGLTAGSDIFGVIGNESYHPNVLGHRLFRDKILEQTSNFTQPMPVPSPNSYPPNENEALTILDAPKAKDPFTYRNIVYADGLAPDVVMRDTPTESSLSWEDGIVQNSSYEAWIHSTPLKLGTFVSAGGADLKLMFNIPSSVPAGFHTLHIYGQNLAGEQIDLYKTIYVAADENDFDGDGLANVDDQCVIIEPAGEDYDQDRIDDACDGEIGEPPAATGTTADDDSKPPENNPETVAGNEPEVVASIQTSQLAATNTVGQSTASTVPEPDNTGFPSVLAENNTTTVQQPIEATDSPQAKLPKNSYFVTLMIVLLFLGGVGFFVIRFLPRA